MRKKAIARANIKPGSGVVRINSQLLSIYGSEMARMRIKEPLVLAGDAAGDYDFSIKVMGGGASSQAEAVRLSIAKGLVKITGDEDLRKKYLAYDRHLLVADSRQTEPQKPCRSSARRGKQTSKR
ncbi:30S ribosomal protein S9 [archaeon]|nr:30S ribosomal protein S9 [archaeon]